MIFINKYGNDNIKNIIVSIIEKQIKKTIVLIASEKYH
jgi:hypothetical protein